MKLYTVVLDYAGNTNISQVRAETPGDAIMLWADQLESHPIGGLNSGATATLKRHLAGDRPVPVEGCRNVWCVSAVLSNELLLLHVVATSQEKDRP
jgi:hypothetical protein